MNGQQFEVYKAKAIEFSKLALEQATELGYQFQERVIIPYVHNVHLPVILPFADMLAQQLAPVLTYVDAGRSALPVIKDIPSNYVGIAVILLHVLNYNITARFEYKTGILRKIFGRLAIYLYALYLIASALVRDHYLMIAIQKDAGTRLLFEPATADFLSFWLITFGILLNLWVLKVLGFKNMYNGDSFGYLLDKPVTNGPYRLFDDPQYFGTTMVLLGYAVKYQSRIGYGLTGVMYLAFSFSVMFLEGPHLARVYADREKRNPVKSSNKTKKTN